ncbi:MAG: LysR family transcriptional regulator [Desulfobacterales bacterium]|nr:LysR family transcriptional regulator [Desulfobacterales bacterium]MCP4163115.1 LysR family transcriptional regulator [Deltaproteobacteria bacterium]
MLPDFNRLKVFYYVYSGKSVISAAQMLNVTQSAVSQHLKKLEEELKTLLFTRLHKRLVPTYEGERLFEIIKPFMVELESGLQSIKDTKVKPSGLLRIGAPAEFGKIQLPEIFASFRQKYPDVTFTLTLGNPEYLINMLNEGQIEFALIDTFLTQKDFSGIYSIEPVIDEEIVLIASSKYYEEVLKRDTSFENIVDKEYITFHAKGMILKNWYRYHFGKMISKFNIVLNVDSALGLVSGVKSHMGMGVMASHLVHEDIQKGDIVAIGTDKKDILNRISLVQFQDKKPSLTEKTFQNHFRDFMKQDHVTAKFSKIIRTP